MILVDTSVWIDHLRSTDALLVNLLERDEVCSHPFVVQELALGHLKDREQVLGSLGELRSLPILAPVEALDLITARRLHGTGLSLVDAHLLGSTLITPGARLWTKDKRLRATAQNAGVAASA